MLRIEGGLFFANAEPVARQIRGTAKRPDVHTIVIDAETVPFIDVTAAQVLEQVARDLGADGVRVVIARNVGQVRDVIHAAPGDSILMPRIPLSNTLSSRSSRRNKRGSPRSRLDQLIHRAADCRFA